jgi:hypothetical protein
MRNLKSLRLLSVKANIPQSKLCPTTSKLKQNNLSLVRYQVKHVGLELLTIYYDMKQTLQAHISREGRGDVRV